MGELKFTRVNTVSINIENAFIEIAKDDCHIIKRTKTKFGYVTAVIQIKNDALKDKLKSWETEINEYLKNEVGTGPVTILYCNSIYPKDVGLIGQKKEEHYIKIECVWIDEKNKPFIQFWHVWKS